MPVPGPDEKCMRIGGHDEVFRKRHLPLMISRNRTLCRLSRRPDAKGRSGFWTIVADCEKLTITTGFTPFGNWKRSNAAKTAEDTQE
ncbi:unnamed protein product [Soboliphyme baturini]|uniref:HNH endonuclease n=1 Tax=Soboliphyme baturini TaxID=241478 RepID=A0A183IE86_9BILA|nr:unnamed protein product [Soboliphyme baturini]